MKLHIMRLPSAIRAVIRVGRVTPHLALLIVACARSSFTATITDLGTLGGSSSYATAINSAGQVVGEANTTNNANSYAFVYAAGVMRDLFPVGVNSYAYAINDGGEIVGMGCFFYCHAFLYSG